MRLQPYAACSAALGLGILLSVGLGPELLPPGRVLRALAGGESPADAGRELAVDRAIVLLHRLPNAAFIALVGAALAGSGAAYQGILRNPLADPYLIGVAPGAALGAVLAMVFVGPTSGAGLAAVPAAAFLGAMLTVAAVYRIARVGKAAPVTTLILCGVAVGSFVSALTFLVLLQTRTELRRALYFMLGGFRLEGWAPVVSALPYVAAGVLVLVLMARHLNVLQFGDEQALELGLDVERAKLVLILAASLAAAAAVAFAGVIGFVGLVVPHAARLLWGPDYRRLVPLSTLAGAAALLVTDAAARTAPGLHSLPLGVVTALLGAPFFLYLLRRRDQGCW
ncbi:MAG: iron ABC transporter permease [Planctomycetes bacterium]|nr:iron ABC transporter permease [Planctomycetota bacterium]